MISLKKYLDQEKEDLTSWLARIVILLLEATALHAIDHDHEEYTEFRRQIRDTIEKFERTTDTRDTLIIAGGAVKLLQVYNQSVERFVRNLSAERQAIIGAMTEFFLKLSHTSEIAGQNLRNIEKDLGRASQLQDVRLLKSKMQDCLTTIAQEATRQEERARELKTPATDLVNPLGPFDQVTGLPGWQHAEARIKEIIEAARPGYVLVLFVKNLHSVNRRVGFAAGDQILTLVGQSVGRALSGKDKLFRWRGPCFVSVMERSESYDHVLAEAARIGAISLEKEIESQGRSILFKASIAWTLMRLHGASQAADTSRAVDAFAAEQTPPQSAS